MDEIAGGPHAQLTVLPDDEGELCVRLSGELDISSVAAVQPQLDELLTREPQPVQLDLGELHFMDSSGIAVLVRLANHFGEVRTRNVTPVVRRVVEVLGLAGRFGLDGTTSDA
jgi:anti-sigma B factor antagonist